MPWLLLSLLSVAAGVLSTTAGLGGGLLLLLCLSLLIDPAQALAITAPALLIGNLHRVLLYFRAIDWPKLWAFAAAGAPAALAGGLLAARVSDVFVRALLVIVTALALVRRYARLELSIPNWALLPAGAGVGALTGASGGAGILASPLLLSSGLSGRAYLGTLAGAAVAMHTGRVIGYGSAGLFNPAVVVGALISTVAILSGNCLGARLRRWAERLPEGALEHGVLVVCVTLSVLGVR